MQHGIQGNKKIYISTSGKGKAPYTLLLRNNGNLQLYGAMGKMQWSSNSARN